MVAIREIADGSDADRPGRDGGSNDGTSGVDRFSGDNHAPELSSENRVVTLQVVDDPIMQ